ncbi:hypothetical protein MIMGU_mgv1a021637mg [Erythranthe guttata]|uniref:Subtilisin-like protease fibronectin type-III domain-containing protein n=1 Tax=Erythranthe guttata TaxID=4155 RepID=A0A022QV98_ERYGU|nr:hypothetical protein MIMGU_mgv1a021637mg [Erythranthe guttata]
MMNACLILLGLLTKNCLIWSKLLKKKPITAGPDGRKANPFDFGSAFVNPTQALDPDLEPSDLNYPSTMFLNQNKSFSISRTLANVGVTENAYEAIVVPSIVFNRVGQIIKFTVYFEVIALSKDHVFGSLTWRSTGYSMTTPLVVRT